MLPTFRTRRLDAHEHSSNFSDMSIVFLLLTSAVLSTFASDWEYQGPHGQDHWDKISNVCSAGKAQSPIDIETKRIKSDRSLKIDMKNYLQQIPGRLFTVVNNGHTVQITLDAGGLSKDKIPSLSGSGVDGSTFQFIQLHFHWHFENDKGSEHLIDGKRYALEMHYVHQNTKYESLPQALNNKDGVAVVGTFFQVTRKNNTYLDEIIAAVTGVVAPETTKTMSNTFRLDDPLPDNIDNFYKYAGSLTTPPCSESVTWILFSDVVGIGESQLNEFRKLMRTNAEHRTVPIDHNVRDAQKLKKRDVFYSGSGTRLSVGLGLTLVMMALGSAMSVAPNQV